MINSGLLALFASICLKRFEPMAAGQGLLHFEKMTSQLNYVLLHKTIDPIKGFIEHLAEKFRIFDQHLII